MTTNAGIVMPSTVVFHISRYDHTLILCSIRKVLPELYAVK